MSIYRAVPRTLAGAGLATLLASVAAAQSVPPTQAPTAPGITRLAPSVRSLRTLHPARVQWIQMSSLGAGVHFLVPRFMVSGWR